MKKKFLVSRNIGLVERRIRALLGVILILLPLQYEAVNWIALLGLVLLLSAFFGRCPFTDLIKALRKILSKKWENPKLMGLSEISRG